MNRWLTGLKQRDADTLMWTVAGALLLCVIFVFDGYGITWDHSVEHFIRNKGPRTFNFWFGGFNADDARFVTGHNPMQFFVYYTIFKGLDAVSLAPGIVDTYHLLTALIGILGFILMYRVGSHIMPKHWALIGALILALHPRWWGHTFTNFKDVPFAVLWLLAVHTLILAAQSPTPKRILLHGLALGLLCVMRIGGLMFVPISIFAIVMGARQSESPPWRQIMSYGALSAVLIVAMQYLSYPYLLLNPVSGWAELFATQKDFEWLGSTLTLGTDVRSSNVPWWYIPTWLVVTLPELILVGLGAAIVGAFVQRTKPSLALQCVLLSVGLPLGYVILMKAPIYDGLRHVLFTIPPLFLLATHGLYMAHQRLKFRWLAPGLVAVGLLASSTQLIQLHPYQALYFNQLGGGLSGAQDKFTLDYWGTTSRESSAWLATHDDGSKRLCVVAQLRQSWNVYLPKWIIEDESELRACPDWAHYAYAFSRNDWLKNSTAYADRHPELWKPVHHIKRQGVIIGTIFKNPNPLSGP